MPHSPRVSIVIPLFDDEEYVRGALDSCLAQTMPDIEVIAVDDASTDGTAAIVAEYAARDARVRLIRQERNASAFQARRVGIEASTAPYVLFLDGDDELAPEAAELTWTQATTSNADVVGFGVEIQTDGSGFPRRLDAALQPKHDVLHGSDIVTTLFPVGVEANGHLWHYLFDVALLKSAYASFPTDAAYYRANDLPISFLALTFAQKYISVAERLYRYNFKRGTSGHTIDGLDRFEFLLSGIDPISAIAADLPRASASSAHPELIQASYASARLHIIANVLNYCVRDTAGSLQQDCLDLLTAKVGATEVLRAAAQFCPQALAALSAHVDAPVHPTGGVHSVLLTTSQLDTGGLQSVLLEQAALLVAEGMRVTIAVMREVSGELPVPAGVDLVHLDGTRLEKIDQWLQVCAEYDVDLIIDHHVLYNENWPWFAIAALSVGVPTIGWVHNFALRPVFDNTQRLSFLTTHMPILLTVVTLSPTDVAFWKLQGIERVVYLPNPPSALAVEGLAHGSVRTPPTGRVELAWWGRLDRSTKRVQQLVEVAGELRKHGVPFRLTIAGPNSRNLTAKELRRLAAQLGVDDAIDFLPELSPAELLTLLEQTDIMVSASAIEGFQLTIVEAQSMGIPVVMFDLPWLSTVRDNAGVVTVPPGDVLEFALAIAALAADPARYASLSHESRSVASHAIETDVRALLLALLAQALPEQYSPEPSIEDAQILTRWFVRYAEQNTRYQQRQARSHDREKEAAAAEARNLRGQRNRAQKEIQALKQSSAFRIGSAITAVPHKVRGLVAPAKKATPVAASNAATPAVRPANDAGQPRLAMPASVERPVRVDVPDVSFVIPVYNSAAWIEECVSSVLAQTGVSVEVICINDGSTDDSRDILRQLADADPRVSVFDQPNSGQSVGRNRGIDLARGRYMIYLDSDDYWPQDALHQLVARADADALDMLLFDCFSFRDGDVDDATWERYATYYQRTYTHRLVQTGAGLMASMRRHKEYRPHVGLYLARTSFVRDSGLRFIPGIVHQDNPYTFRLLLNASRTAHARLDAYARRLRPGSTITTLNAERSARGYFLSYLEMTRALADRTLPENVEGPVGDIVSYVYQGAAKQFPLLTESEAEGIRTLDPHPDAQKIFTSLLFPETIDAS